VKFVAEKAVNESSVRLSEIRYKPLRQAEGKPWGRVATASTPTARLTSPKSQRHFTGQRKDSGSGLLFYNARWYDPAIGRFISADTLVPNPGNLQSLNRYTYAANNPLRFVDPSGFDPIDAVWEQAFYQ